MFDVFYECLVEERLQTAEKVEPLFFLLSRLRSSDELGDPA